MAGAMRRMGIYLGLVEDDDTRAYGRYDARSADDLDHGRYGRYGEDRYDDDYADPAYADDYARAGYDEEPALAETPVRDPEPIGVRRVAPRTLGLAPTASGSSAARLGGASHGSAPVHSSGPVSAAAALVREPVVAPEPEPAPAPTPAAAKSYRITTLHPRTYNEARTIGERFRDGMPVIMNLTEMDDADAKRLVDFAAGLSFGLRGSIERVTAKVFLLSPQDVAVTPEDKAKIREGGFGDKS
ncbi:cell division protein [Blastococcus sp. TBT05-19]|uniref:cell division protein SepF n=1 Tax=Blastococcus sp. TBT05-19 TaxID=2250581 RepID=UPI000DE8DCF2|nr:cell division protein SepF [Blastococcus sp. TBT05-19]RBY88941.1 cell division protein [Blastococcus sp. TBT05-19]